MSIFTIRALGTELRLLSLVGGTRYPRRHPSALYMLYNQFDSSGQESGSKLVCHVENMVLTAYLPSEPTSK